MWRWWKEKIISHRGQFCFSGQTRSLAMLWGFIEVPLRSTEISRPPVTHLQTSHAGVWYCTHSTMPSTLPHLLSFAKRALHQSWICSFYSQTDANPATWCITVSTGASITGPASLQQDCSTCTSRETVESHKLNKIILQHLQYISVTAQWGESPWLCSQTVMWIDQSNIFKLLYQY